MTTYKQIEQKSYPLVCYDEFLYDTSSIVITFYLVVSGYKYLLGL